MDKINLIQPGNSSEVNWAVVVDNQIRSTGSARLHCADETIVSHTVAWSENAGFHKARRSCLRGGCECADFAFHNSLRLCSLYLTNLPHLSSCLFCIAPAAVLSALFKPWNQAHANTEGACLWNQNLLSLFSKKHLKKGERLPSVVDFYTPSATCKHTLTGSNMETYYKQVVFIFIGIHMVCCTVGSFKRPTCRVRQPQ